MDLQKPFVCTTCQNKMYPLHCKVICYNCGAKYDCSDLEFKQDMTKSDEADDSARDHSSD